MSELTCTVVHACGHTGGGGWYEGEPECLLCHACCPGSWINLLSAFRVHCLCSLLHPWHSRRWGGVSGRFSTQPHPSLWGEVGSDYVHMQVPWLCMLPSQQLGSIWGHSSKRILGDHSAVHIHHWSMSKSCDEAVGVVSLILILVRLLVLDWEEFWAQ